MNMKLFHFTPRNPLLKTYLDQRLEYFDHDVTWGLHFQSRYKKKLNIKTKFKENTKYMYCVSGREFMFLKYH